MFPKPLRSRRALAALSVIAVAFAFSSTLATATPVSSNGLASERDPAMLSSEIMPLTHQALLLDMARTSAGIFLVGERGALLRSTDAGRSWKQLMLPTRLTMTSIATANDDLWVAGHGGQIFHSSDHGETWSRQRIDLWSEDSLSPTAGSPILDLHFIDGKNGFALGAFSLLLRTRDGGTTWEPLSLPKPEQTPSTAMGENADLDWTFSVEELELADESDPHLNAMVSTPDGTLFLAGERGAIFRSRDGGEQWERLDFPYNGSMFGLVAWGDGHVLTYGLRGHAFESLDAGETWSQLETATEITLHGGVALEGGGVLLVGNEGLLLHRDDALSPLRRSAFETDAGETPVLTSALSLEDRFLLIGEKGVVEHVF